MKKKSPVGWHVLTIVVVLALVALVIYLAVNGVGLFCSVNLSGSEIGSGRSFLL